MKWGEHAKHVCSKLARTSYALVRLKNMVPVNIKLQIYRSLFKCHIDYCLPVWGNCPSPFTKTIEKINKKTVRAITNSKYNSHTEPQLKKLKLLTFSDTITYLSGVFAFEIAIGKHPLTIRELFCQSKDFRRNYEFIRQLLPYKYLTIQVPHSIINIWNSLPNSAKGWLTAKVKDPKNTDCLYDNTENIFDISSYRINGFKKTLMDNLFDNYSSVVKCKNVYCEDCFSGSVSMT